MISLEQKTPKELNIAIAANMVRLRKRKKITQKELATLSGVSFASIKRFEQTGEISLASLTKIAMVLDATDGFESLFTNVPFSSIDEVLEDEKNRKAGRFFS